MPMSETQLSRETRYSSAEAAEIVREALALKHNEERSLLSREDLEDIAQQCGVDPASLDKALENRALNDKKRQIRAKWRRKALSALAMPVLFCALFVYMNVKGGGFPWAIFPIAFWLLPALASCRSRLFPTDELLTKTARRAAAA